MRNNEPLIPKDIYTPPDHQKVRSMPKSPIPQPTAEETGPIYKIEPINLKRAHGPGIGLTLLVVIIVLATTGILWWLGQQHKQKQANYAQKVLQQENQIENEDTPPLGVITTE